jgi:hypothetical protein
VTFVFIAPSHQELVFTNVQALLPAQRVSSSGLFDILTPNVPFSPTG